MEAEPSTIDWFAFQVGGPESTTFGIIDFFEGDEGRGAHLTGKVAEALFAKAEEFFDGGAEIVPTTVVASRVL